MVSEPEYDAELHNFTDLGAVFVGEIRNDSKLRFSDGQVIRTSKTLSVENGILQTRNTRYKLIEGTT